jgi:hypothetical protein
MRTRSDWARLMAFGVLTAWAATIAAAAEKTDPSGTWTWVRALEGESGRSVLKLSYKDGKLTGVYKRLGQAVPIINGKFEKNEVSFEADGKWGEQTIHGKFQGKVSKDAIRGEIEVSVDGGSLPLSWVATRGVDFDDVTGTWTLKIEIPDSEALPTSLQLSADGEKLSGSLKSPFGEQPAKMVKLAGSDLSWTTEGSYQGKMAKAVCHAKTEGDRMKGTLEYEYDGNTGTIQFTGQRTVDKSHIQPKAPDKKSVSQKGDAFPRTDGCLRS